MANTDRKEGLFEDFFNVAREALEVLESQFNVSGVIDQVFGANADDEQARAKLRSSRPWETLSVLYDYAVEGEDRSGDTNALVIDGSDVLKLVTTENHWPSDDWNNILAMADGRYGLDDGQVIALTKVALLAGVDIRTARNAASAGELIAFKRDDAVYVENASARRWLRGRRGFKPTVEALDGAAWKVENVRTPGHFASFLQQQRLRIGADPASDKWVGLHPSLTLETLQELEGGVFTLPLDAVFPLADFYDVGRKELLACVMRVFFEEELRLLTAGGPQLDTRQ